MAVEHVEFLVEELSAESLLRGLLPRVLGSVSFGVFPHNGKYDLLKKLPGRFAGYAKCLPETHRVVVLVDCDNDNCRELKKRVEQFAVNAGLRAKDGSHTSNSWQVLTRIAVEEIEAWYFGDWEAVRNEFPRVRGDVPRSAKYRDPDAIAGGTCEALERELRYRGYYQGGLQKIDIATRLGPLLDRGRSRSRSFQVFWDAVQSLSVQ